MRRKKSTAWEEIGYTVPDLPVANTEAQLARVDHRAEVVKKRAEQDARHAPRAVAKSAFAMMHLVVDGGGEA